MEQWNVILAISVITWQDDKGNNSIMENLSIWPISQQFPSYRLSLWISHNWDTVIKHFTQGPFVQKHNFSKKEDVVPRCSVFGTSKDICCWTDRSSRWIRYLCMLCIMHVQKPHCMLTFRIKNTKYSHNQGPKGSQCILCLPNGWNASNA